MTEVNRKLIAVPEVLVPYTEFEAAELSRQLSQLVVVNREMLALRGLAGVINRYSNPETALSKVRKGQAEQASIGHYAVVNEAGNVKGAASVFPGLPLTKQRIPMPPVLARGPLAKPLAAADVNVHAWTGLQDTELLTDAYRDAIVHATGWWRYVDSPKAWTLEPKRAPKEIHEAIAKSGLDKVASRRYDDAESRARIPLRSTLYASLYSEWFTAHGKEKELAKRSKSFMTAWDEELQKKMPTGK